MEFLVVLLTLFVSMGTYLFGHGLSNSGIDSQSRPKSKLETEDEKGSVSPPQGWVTRNSSVKQMIFAFLAVPLLTLIIVSICIYRNFSRTKWTHPALFAIFAGCVRYELSNALKILLRASLLVLS